MILRRIGIGFIATGAFILLFLAYELFGTNFVTARHQKEAADDITKEWRSAAVAQAADPGGETPQSPDLGEGIAQIQIPKIEVDWVVVEGVKVGPLKRGPGHMPGTAYPGERGNMVISGHRTTYGAPFMRLDELREGDLIDVHTANHRFTYRVSESKIVAPNDLSVVTPTTDSRLTLTTCHPRFSAAKRLIVVAHLVGAQDVAPAA